MGHFIEHLERVEEMERIDGVGSSEGRGSIRVGVETGFEEMGMEGLGVGRGPEVGACFEESGEGERVKGWGRGREEVGEEGKCFFIETICYEFC